MRARRLKQTLLKIINKSTYLLRGTKKLWNVNTTANISERVQMFYLGENKVHTVNKLLSVFLLLRHLDTSPLSDMNLASIFSQYGASLFILLTMSFKWKFQILTKSSYQSFPFMDCALVSMENFVQSTMTKIFSYTSC